MISLYFLFDILVRLDSGLLVPRCCGRRTTDFPPDRFNILVAQQQRHQENRTDRPGPTARRHSQTHPTDHHRLRLRRYPRALDRRRTPTRTRHPRHRRNPPATPTDRQGLRPTKQQRQLPLVHRLRYHLRHSSDRANRHHTPGPRQGLQPRRTPAPTHQNRRRRQRLRPLLRLARRRRIPQQHPRPHPLRRTHDRPHRHPPTRGNDRICPGPQRNRRIHPPTTPTVRSGLSTAKGTPLPVGQSHTTHTAHQTHPQHKHQPARAPIPPIRHSASSMNRPYGFSTPISIGPKPPGTCRKLGSS